MVSHDQPSFVSAVFSIILTGLIHWKIVIHRFIDGYLQFVHGIQANLNNFATAVLDLFEDITNTWIS